MWTPTTRRQHSRAGLRYASDLTDAEWRLLEPLLPRPRRQGRRWAWPQREIINAIFYVLRAGCAWRLLPDSFPPWRTIYRWFARLRDGGVFESLTRAHAVRNRARGSVTDGRVRIDALAEARLALPAFAISLRRGPRFHIAP